jgi:hypothetical protein
MPLASSDFRNPAWTACVIVLGYDVCLMVLGEWRW